MEEKNAAAQDQKLKTSPETEKPLEPEAMEEVVGGVLPHGGVIVRNGDPCDGSEILKR
jgi:hypothetical protein